MRKFTFLYIVTALLWFLAVLVKPAHADMRYFCLYELAEQSDLVFTGKVTALTDDAASIAVSEVLSGKLETNEVSVTPIKLRHCVGLSINFSIDEEVLIFGKKGYKQHVTVAADGHGKRALYPNTQQTEIAAAKRLLVISELNEHAKNKAMLAEVKSNNERLRFEAHHYIISRISQSERRDVYKDDLVSLIQDTDPEIQRTGLQGVQFIQDPNLIPLLAERTHSENVHIVKVASMALAQHDTPESAGALIALTKHDNPEIRIRAAIDLGNGSTHPEAKEALRVLLDDKDPKVRAMAPRRFVRWFRRGQADEVLPKLVEMLNDEEPKVCAEAAHVLGECRNSELVPPLLKTLKNHPQDKDIQWMTLNALYCHYSKGDNKAQELINDEINLITIILTGMGPDTDYRSSFNAVGILDLSSKEVAKESLKWAAKNHPNKEIRAYAQRCLSK